MGNIREKRFVKVMLALLVFVGLLNPVAVYAEVETEHTVTFVFEEKNSKELPDELKGRVQATQVGNEGDLIQFPNTEDYYEAKNDADWTFEGWKKEGSDEFIKDLNDTTIGNDDSTYKGIWSSTERRYNVLLSYPYEENLGSYLPDVISLGYKGVIGESIEANNANLKITDKINPKDLWPDESENPNGRDQVEGVNYIAPGYLTLGDYTDLEWISYEWYSNGYYINGKRVDLKNPGTLEDYIGRNKDNPKNIDLVFKMIPVKDLYDVHLDYKLMYGNLAFNGDTPDVLTEVVGAKRDEFNLKTGKDKDRFRIVTMPEIPSDAKTFTTPEGEWSFKGYVDAEGVDNTLVAYLAAPKITEIRSITKPHNVIGLFELTPHAKDVSFEYVSIDGQELPAVIGTPSKKIASLIPGNVVEFPDVNQEIVKDKANKNAWVFKGWRRKGSTSIIVDPTKEMLELGVDAYEGVWKKYPAIQVEMELTWHELDKPDKKREFNPPLMFDAIYWKIDDFNSDYKEVYYGDKIAKKEFIEEDKNTSITNHNLCDWYFKGYRINGEERDFPDGYTVLPSERLNDAGEKEEVWENQKIELHFEYKPEYHNVTLSYNLYDDEDKKLDLPEERLPDELKKIVVDDVVTFNETTGQHKHYNNEIALPVAHDVKDKNNDGNWMFDGFELNSDKEFDPKAPITELYRDEELYGTYRFVPNVHTLKWSYDFEEGVPEDKTALKKYLDASDAFNTKVSAMTFTKGMDVVVPDDFMRESIDYEDNEGAWMLKSYRVNGKEFDALNPGTFGAEDLHVVGTIGFKKKSKIRFTYVHNGNGEVPNEILKPTVEVVKGFAGETVSVPETGEVKDWTFFGWRKAGQDAFVDTDTLSFEETDAMYEGVWEFVELKKDDVPSVEEKTTTEEAVEKPQKSDEKATTEETVEKPQKSDEKATTEETEEKPQKSDEKTTTEETEEKPQKSDEKTTTEETVEKSQKKDEKSTVNEVVVKPQKKVVVANAVMEVKGEKVPSTSDQGHLLVYGVVCLSGLIAMVLSAKKLLV